MKRKLHSEEAWAVIREYQGKHFAIIGGRGQVATTTEEVARAEVRAFEEKGVRAVRVRITELAPKKRTPQPRSGR